MKHIRLFLCIVIILVVGLMTPFAALADNDGDTCYMTWEEYVAANGVTDWDWNDAADAIDTVIDHAVELYAAGDVETAYEYAKATYWGYYETTGFERNVMTYISGSRVSSVELQFTTFRKAVKNDLGVDTVQEEGAKLSAMLHEDALILSPEGGSDACCMTWEEYVAANGITNWNWNDAANAIDTVIDHAVELYAAGDKDQAYEYAKATYWGYYETTGFERNVMTYISGSRVSSVELQFTTFRKAVKNDLGLDAVQEEGAKLSAMLHEDALILSPEGSEIDVSSGTSSGGATATFLGSFFIILREGLEAILVVGGIIMYLLKSGNKRGVIPVYIGSVFAILCSFAMAFFISWLKNRNPEATMSQEIIEGVAALLAVVVLFYVSNWMVSKAEAAAWEGYIRGKVESSAARGSMFALGFTAWLAVFREGAEVILFYQPMLNEGHRDMVWMGFIVGCVVLAVIFLVMRTLGVRLPLKPVFMVTSILMAIMCVCFLGAGIKELMEGGVLDGAPFMLASPPWLSWIPYTNALDVLGIYPLVGTIVPQLILLAFLIFTLVFHVRKNKRIRLQLQAQTDRVRT